MFSSVELCREDPLCSSVTVCTTEGSPHRGPSVGCPVEFGASNCALHRQQDFQYGIVSPGLSTLIPIRKDLRPVTLRGFAVLRPDRLEAVVAQVDGDQLRDRGLVFDNQYAGKSLHGQRAFQRTADSISSRAVWRTSLPLTR